MFTTFSRLGIVTPSAISDCVCENQLTANRHRPPLITGMNTDGTNLVFNAANSGSFTVTVTNALNQVVPGQQWREVH